MRSLWPAAILLRVLRAYQPGGHQERSLLLHELSAQKECKGPLISSRGSGRGKGVRVDELGATFPDVLLQVRALDAVCSPFLSRFPQTSFRVSTFRMETHLDERPTDVTLMEFLTQSEVDAFMENCAKRWQTREGTYQLKRRRLKPDVRDSPEYPCADIDMADI